LPAEPEAQIGTMDAECNALLAQLAIWHDCPNVEDNEAAAIKSTIEYAENDFAVGKKGLPDEAAQHEIAIRCHRAAASVAAAVERCRAGKPPRVWD
jgi:hypothetical protein